MPLFAVLFALCFLIFPGQAQAASDVVISQVYGGGGNSGAPLSHDYVELFNRGEAPITLTGWSLQYSSAAGTSWANQNMALIGTIQPKRYYLIRLGTTNAAVGTPLPTPDLLSSINISGTSGKLALVNTTTALPAATCPVSATIVDLVGFGSSANCNEGGANTPAPSNITAILRAEGGCVDTDNNGADFAAGTPAPRNSATAARDCDVPPPPDTTPTFAIHEIQGSGSQSPLLGTTVKTHGIVTARISNGFFLQTPDADSDADPATSQGIFVFTSSAPPAAAAVGNGVMVKGAVAEFIPSSAALNRPLTELTAPQVTEETTGNPLPAPVAITTSLLTTSGGLEQLEHLEGMRVSATSLTVVAPTGGFKTESAATSNSDGVFFTVLTGTARPFREAGIGLLEPVPAGAPAGVPRFDNNPERIRVDSDRQTGTAAINVVTGAVLENMTGVLHYDFGTYNIFPDAASFTFSNPAAAAVTQAALGEYTIASFNMERFYDTVNEAGLSDAVLTAAGLERRMRKASLAIRNVLRSPDILAVVEMENLATLQALAARIDADAAADGQPAPGYQAYLEPGNDIGNINVGFLVKPSRATVLNVVQLGKDAVYINPANGEPELLNDRPPLQLRASVIHEGVTETITVVVNHLRSLNGVTDADGRVRAKRRAQAEYLAELLQQLQADGENVVSVGDYNAFEVSDGYVDLIGTILGTPAPATEVVLASSDLVTPDLTNLMSLLPQEQRYSYVFDGSAQVLDHVIVNSTMLGRFSRIEVSRSNADFPEVFRSDDTRPERLSDHDAPVAYFLLPRDTFAPTVSVTGVVDGATYLLGTVPAAGCEASDEHSGLAGPATFAAVVTGGNSHSTGTFTATCTATDNVGNVGSATATFTVHYAFGGFLPPLADGAAKKSGSTVPVKFQLADGNGIQLFDISMIASLSVLRLDACGGSTGTSLPAVQAGNTVLRYEPTDEHFIFNWKTTGLAAGCYQFVVTLDDGQSLAAPVTIR